VNTTAEVKAETDVCCTSGNAEAVLRTIPEEQEILFLPDMFLGAWLQRKTGRKNMHIWMGECHVHAGIRTSELIARQEALPRADLLIHPECGCTSSYIYDKGRGRLPENTFVLS